MESPEKDKPDTPLDHAADEFRPTRRRVVYLIIFSVFVLYSYQLWVTRGDPKWNEMFFGQFRSIVGLPAAAAGAFIIVTLFRVSDGAIEMKIPGVEFKGASGPVILWALCFLAIVHAISTLWGTGP